VSASDLECGKNSPVTYRMARMLAPLSEFRVDPIKGDICVQGTLDYETATSYQFQVEAVDADNLTTQAVIQVEISDVNDNHPKFEPKDYAINVMANANPGPLVTVQARDRDSGLFGTVTYSIVSGNDKGYFTINNNTGSIQLIKVLPNGLFTLIIRATDGGGLTSLDNAVVTVSVITGNVFPPIFTPTMFNFTVSEAASIGQKVGQVPASLSNPTSEIKYSIRFQTVDWFRLDTVTGELFSKASLDREVSPFVVLSIQAEAYFPPVFAVAQVNITILDINDNAPYFPSTTMLELEVREDEVVGSNLYVAQAFDKDLGNNGTVRYRLQDTADKPFSIDSISGKITLNRNLDYEAVQNYSIGIIAEDLGTPRALSANMTLTVRVKDVNDNAPQFDRALYLFSVSEDVPLGQNVNVASATDKDSGNNKKISYSFVESRYSSVFGISPVSGQIWTREPLDRELHDYYEFTIKAVDHGSPQLSATALVKINVTDVNDNQPEFSRDEYRFSIAENLPPNSLVGQLTATDRDAGSNSLLDFYPSGLNNNFTVDPRNGEIRTKVSLDRELVSEHVIIFYVSDSGSPSLSSQTRVRIKVEDVNDNSPIFQRQGPFILNVSENRPKGTEVTTLVAIDSDEGDNGLVTYFFDQNQSEGVALNSFEIHPRSGKVTTKEVLDYETLTVYHLVVVARDNGRIFMETSQQVTVQVLDVNDQAPMFPSKAVTFDCVENVSLGTVVGRVKATDKDSGENGKVNYYLVGGNIFSALSVDRVSGNITTVAEIDYEVASTHILNIQALDSSAALPKSSNITVTIRIIDVNDNAPVFDQDPVIIRTIAENTPKNQVIHKFIATDRDSGVNGTVRFSIETYSGKDEGLGPYFDINPSTGEMYISGLIDYEAVKQISVMVKAQDSCPSPCKPLSSLMTTIIFVTDINDNAPVFESPSELTVSEEEVAGYVAVVVVAVDADSNIDNSGNNIVKYYIVSGNEDGKFLLDPDTGYLTIYDALDHEVQTGYLLNISAENLGLPKMVSYQQLNITVADANDNPPIFQKTVYHANISENANPLTSFFTVKATDADEGANGQLTYQIPTGIAGDKFSVDGRTGVVSTTLKLDREEMDSYILTVYVKDGAYPFHYSSCTVFVTVTDLNDNPPIFKNPPFQISIPENRDQSSVLTVVALDRDIGDNARITYEITGGNDGSFSIDPQYGHLSTQALDRETRALYNLTITARDHGASPISASTYVLVNVSDENDNSPAFDKSIYEASISEDISPGQVMLTVTATDPDAGLNGLVMYSLSNETDGFFEINSTSGEIYTSGTFDREKNASFSFIIMASDSGVSGPRNTTARVDVTITDVNDNAPNFTMVPFTANIRQDLQIGATVLVVTALDPDLDANGRVVYSLMSYAGSDNSLQYFQVDSTTGVVRTKASLSPISGAQRLYVVATDSAIAPQAKLSSTGMVEITVGSPATNTLTFSSNEYHAAIDENSSAGTNVANVSASFGQGQASPGQISYRFASGNENQAFQLNSATGVITVFSPDKLDYEKIHRFRLTLTASSGNNIAYATVWVDLKDVNDNVPKFSQSKYVSAIWENNPPGVQTYVTQVFANDADSGKNGFIFFTIIGGNDDNVFKISLPQTGIVVTSEDAAPLDREVKPNGYRLTIEARDNGYPPKFTTCILIISIVDENDTPPYFPEIQDLYVPENRDVGYTVVMATANDVDLNPILVYDFMTDGNPDNTFSLDSSSGRLTLAKPLDHEKKSKYIVGIQVSDGVPDHTQSKWITINIDDINDNAPVFSKQSYEVALPEQTSINQSVLTVQATDADSGENAYIEYSMAPSPVSSFSINPQTGTIFTNRIITFTSGESIIQLVVVAKDKGSPVLSSMVAVHIEITDVNKYPPIFVEPLRYSANISELAVRGQVVLQVSAIDNDTNYRGDNINYTLIGSGTSFFYIRQRTGQIFYNGGIDYEQTKQYQLTAVATDRGIPAKNATIPVIIRVLDENDNPPLFLENSYSITLDENFTTQKVFMTVNATDADSGPNAEIKFSITSGNTEGIFFNPRGEGGLIIMQDMQLDYETQTHHRLIMRAMDCYNCSKSTVRLSAFVTVDIFVRDVNEFKPKFPVKFYLEEVHENATEGTFVFQANAYDGDGGEMGILTYSLMSEYDYRLFAIDPYTGDITTKVVFDYEAVKSPHLYNLTICATDRGSFYDMAEVTIRLLDVDEFPPHLNAEEYKFEVPGSAKAGDFIGQVSATDADGGEAGRLVYVFLETSQYFAIDSVSGNITVAVTLNSDPPKVATSRKKRAFTSDSESLVIQVSSGQPGSLRDVASCIITIDRLCAGCQAPESVQSSAGMDGGILAAIIVICVLFFVVAIIVILIVLYRRRQPRKQVPSYPSDSISDLQPPPHLPHDRSVFADVIRRPMNAHVQENLIASDVFDQSQNSASSGRGSAEAEEEDEEISRINSNNFLNSSQAFRQKAMPDSGIQHDDDTLSEPTAQTHQEYLANLGIDSSKIGKNKQAFITTSNHSNGVKHLGRSAESMHQFSDEGGGEGGVDTDLEKLTDMETDEEGRPQIMSFHEPDTHNVGSLSSVVNSEEVNSGSYNWDYLIDWGPQYQPLAHVFSEIAKLKDESITPKKQPIKTVPQRQINSLLKPQVRTVPPPIITNVPPMGVALLPSDDDHDLADPSHQTSTLPIIRNMSQSKQQSNNNNHPNHYHHNHLPHHNHGHLHHGQLGGLQQQQPQMVKTSHQAPASNNQFNAASYNQVFSPHNKLLSHPNTRSPHLTRHPQQHHSPRMGIHPHHHPPPPLHPPPPIPQPNQSTSGSRSQPTSGHASTMNISLCSLPRSPISYESSVTSAAMTPSLTPSLSPLATRSPSVSPVVSSGHTTPGKSSSRQNLIKQSSNSHSNSSNSEKEFTI
ncbi:protein dachsous, partial [Biomphalaria glabrata]